MDDELWRFDVYRMGLPAILRTMEDGVATADEIRADLERLIAVEKAG